MFPHTPPYLTPPILLYLCTAGILYVYPPCKNCLTRGIAPLNRIGFYPYPFHPFPHYTFPLALPLSTRGITPLNRAGFCPYSFRSFPYYTFPPCPAFIHPGVHPLLTAPAFVLITSVHSRTTHVPPLPCLYPSRGMLPLNCTGFYPYPFRSHSLPPPLSSRAQPKGRSEGSPASSLRRASPPATRSFRFRRACSYGGMPAPFTLSPLFFFRVLAHSVLIVLC